MCCGLHLAAAQDVVSRAFFSEVKATFYLHLAAVSTCANDSIEAWSCGDDCNTTLPNVVSGSMRVLGPGGSMHGRGFVARLQNIPSATAAECAAVFTGTSFYDSRNIEADLGFWRVSWPLSVSGNCTTRKWCEGCLVHGGFARTYEELREELLAAVEELQCASLAIVGHSLGAALATLASLELRMCHSATVRVPEVWTFASPRVGNKEFAEAYMTVARLHQLNPPMWRVVRRLDLIPQVPPPWLLGYSHVPSEVQYPTDFGSARPTQCDDGLRTLEDPACAYPSGSMQYHHGYLGVYGTDENNVSISCISEAALQQKQHDLGVMLLGLVACLVLLCLFCLSGCCFCLLGWRCPAQKEQCYVQLGKICPAPILACTGDELRFPRAPKCDQLGFSPLCHAQDDAVEPPPPPKVTPPLPAPPPIDDDDDGKQHSPGPRRSMFARACTVFACKGSTRRPAGGHSKRQLIVEQTHML